MEKELFSIISRVDMQLQSYGMDGINNRHDANVTILESVVDKILKLKSIPHDLEQQITQFATLADSKVFTRNTPALSGMDMAFVGVNEITNQELINILMLDSEIQKQIIKESEGYCFEDVM